MRATLVDPHSVGRATPLGYGHAVLFDSFPQPVPERRSVAVFIAGIFGVGMIGRFRCGFYGWKRIQW
jgi:hypothetical protein